MTHIHDSHNHNHHRPTGIVQGDIYILGRKGKDGRQYRPTPDGNFWEYMDEGDETWTVTDVPARGEQGEPLTWEDLTPEQRESLKGEQGEPLTWDDLTPEQKEELKGDKGDPGQSGVDVIAIYNGPPTEKDQTGATGFLYSPYIVFTVAHGFYGDDRVGIPQYRNIPFSVGFPGAKSGSNAKRILVKNTTLNQLLHKTIS